MTHALWGSALLLLLLLACSKPEARSVEAPEVSARREAWVRRNAAELIEPYHQKVEDLLEGQIGSIDYGVVGNSSGSLGVLRDSDVSAWGTRDINIKRLKNGVEIFVKHDWRAPRFEFHAPHKNLIPVTDVFVLDGGAQ